MRHLENFRMVEAIEGAGSIRRAAVDMNITSSALNRKVKAFEAELGAEIFERHARGVRLNAAGRLLLRHIQAQTSDLALVRSQIDDLRGLRRGRVSLACSQALQPYFLPAQIAAFQKQYPDVAFTAYVRDRALAERDLSEYRSDLAIVFDPVYMVDFEVLLAVKQPLCAVMRRDHPLAGQTEVPLRDCLAGLHVTPTPPYGVRNLLDLATRNLGLELNPPLQCDSFEMMRNLVVATPCIGFQIPIGISTKMRSDLSVAVVSEEDVPAGTLYLGKLRDRTLPVAAALFADQVKQALSEIDFNGLLAT